MGGLGGREGRGYCVCSFEKSNWPGGGCVCVRVCVRKERHSLK